MVYFKHEIIGKLFTETLNKAELRINLVRFNRARPVQAVLAVRDYISKV